MDIETLYTLIAKRDTNKTCSEEFLYLINSLEKEGIKVKEIEQIKNGYDNTLIASAILKKRAELLIN